MSDRLKELQRHRALLQEHLAWLDREIAAQGDNPVPPAALAVPPAPTFSPAANVTPAPAAFLHPVKKPALPPAPAKPSVDPHRSAAAAEQILSKYKDESQSVAGDVKRGCFLYFFLALGVIAVGVIALYFHSVHR